MNSETKRPTSSEDVASPRKIKRALLRIRSDLRSVLANRDQPVAVTLNVCVTRDKLGWLEDYLLTMQIPYADIPIDEWRTTLVLFFRDRATKEYAHALAVLETHSHGRLIITQEVYSDQDGCWVAKRAMIRNSNGRRKFELAQH